MLYMLHIDVYCPFDQNVPLSNLISGFASSSENSAADVTVTSTDKISSCLTAFQTPENVLSGRNSAADVHSKNFSGPQQGMVSTHNLAKIIACCLK